MDFRGFSVIFMDFEIFALPCARTYRHGRPDRQALERDPPPVVRRLHGPAVDADDEVARVGDLDEGARRGGGEGQGRRGAEGLAGVVAQVEVDVVGDVGDLRGAGAGLGEGERHAPTLGRATWAAPRARDTQIVGRPGGSRRDDP